MYPANPCQTRKSQTSLPGSPQSEFKTRANRTQSRITSSTRSLTMSNENTISRRGLFMKMGILFNGLVAAALAVPVVRFLLSSITRGRANAYLSWVSVGSVTEFPEGETQLATFLNPSVTPTDGTPVDTACWIRPVAAEP